ncbi:MAG: hypothetical protein IKJ14_01210 [Clostridia bacterium]|nr:hypothetical protein [Clostridia bacterium]
MNAYLKGSKFDSWGEFLSRENWDSAFIEENVEKQTYKAKIDENSILAWEFINVGVSKKFLLKEKGRAYQGEVTGGCQTGCKACGLQSDCPIVKRGV